MNAGEFEVPFADHDSQRLDAARAAAAKRSLIDGGLYRLAYRGSELPDEVRASLGGRHKGSTHRSVAARSGSDCLRAAPRTSGEW